MNTQISFKGMAEKGKEILASQGPITYEEAKAQVDRLRKGSYLRRMEWKEIEDRFKEAFSNRETRRIKIYTGAAGAELFDEAMQAQVGIKRIYIGKKVPRIMKSIEGIRLRKSYYTGKHYRLFGKIAL